MLTGDALSLNHVIIAAISPHKFANCLGIGIFVLCFFHKY